MKNSLRQMVPKETRHSLRKNFDELQRSMRVSAKSFSETLNMDSWEAGLLRPEDFPVFELSPTLLQRGLKNGYPPGNFIYDGNWDIEAAPVTENRRSIFETVNDMFLHNKNYRETPQYKKMTKAIDAYLKGEVKNPATLGGYWCRSHADVDEYFAKLIRAYESIKTKGYMKQSEVQKEKPGDIKKAQDEIQILLDRNGKIVLGRGGTHRTFIVKLLGVKKVYVILRGVHKQFLDEVVEKKSSTESIQSALEKHMFTYKPQ